MTKDPRNDREGHAQMLHRDLYSADEWERMHKVLGPRVRAGSCACEFIDTTPEEQTAAEREAIRRWHRMHAERTRRNRRAWTDWVLGAIVVAVATGFALQMAGLWKP